MADQLLQSERTIITNSVNSGFTCDKIWHFLSVFQVINMNERTLWKRLGIWGLRRRNLTLNNALVQELRLSKIIPSFISMLKYKIWTWHSTKFKQYCLLFHFLILVVLKRTVLDLEKAILHFVLASDFRQDGYKMVTSCMLSPHKFVEVLGE